MSKEKLRIGVVGLGKMGLLHSCILNVMPNVELVAFCEKSGMIRRFFKKIFKRIIIVDDVEKLTELNLDAVYITTPIPSHFPIAKSIYSKKITRNLFIEKTLASNYDEATQLCKLANDLGDVNMVGYMRRFAVTFQKARELLTEDAIGEITSFNAYAFSSDFCQAEKGLKASAARGGVLRDLGCHIADLALWFFGDLKVTSVTLESLTSEDSEDSAHFEIRNSNGLKGAFDVSWCKENYRMPEVGLMINGSKGTIEVDDDKLVLKRMSEEPKILYRHDLQDNVFFWLGGPEYFRENQSFVKSIFENHNGEPSFYTASKVDQIIDQVKERAERRE